MLEKPAEVFELGHRNDELLEVFEPSGGIRRPVRLPHRGITRFVEDDLNEVGMLNAFGLPSPAIKRGDEARERVAGGRPDLITGTQRSRRIGERLTLGARQRV